MEDLNSVVMKNSEYEQADKQNNAADLNPLDDRSFVKGRKAWLSNRRLHDKNEASNGFILG